VLVVIAVNLTFSYEGQTVRRDNPLLIQALSAISAMLGFLFLLLEMFFRLQIYLKIHLMERKASAIYRLYVILVIMCTKNDLFPFVFHCATSLLGLLYNETFFAVQMFTFVFVSDTMNSVLQALKLRWRKFLGIFALILIILNFYAYVGFFVLSERFVAKVSFHTPDGRIEIVEE